MYLLDILYSFGRIILDMDEILENLISQVPVIA